MPGSGRGSQRKARPAPPFGQRERSGSEEARRSGVNRVGIAAKATFACANDAAHVLTVAAEITGVRTEASGDADPYVVYTASVTLEGKEYTDTQTRVIHRYTIRFVNADGKELQSGKVEEGTMPVYNGETPVNEGKGRETVRFAGWTPELVPVTGDAAYTAVYVSAVPEIPFIPIFPISVGSSEHGSVSVSPEQAAAGGTVTVTAEADEGYELGSIRVRSDSGTPIPVTQNDDGSFSFRQTVGGAQVDVSFGWAESSSVTCRTTPITISASVRRRIRRSCARRPHTRRSTARSWWRRWETKARKDRPFIPRPTAP